MRRHLLVALAALLGSIALPSRVLAYQAGGSLRAHGHSSVLDGGANIDPLTVDMTSGTATSFKISSGAFIVDGAGATVSLPSGIVIDSPVFPSAITFTGNLSAASAIAVSSGIAIGDPLTGKINSGGAFDYYMKSVDGASQSSGCIVALGYSGSDATTVLTFTSTTTASFSGHLGVLMETCAPSAICRVMTHGVALSNPTSSCAAGCVGQTSTTRCRADANAVGINTVLSLRWLGATTAGTSSPVTVGY